MALSFTKIVAIILLLVISIISVILLISTTTATDSKCLLSTASHHKVTSNLSSSVNSFALDFYKALSKQESSNVLISPVSISAALAMVLLGARSETECELFAGLRLNDEFESSDQVHEAFKKVGYF